MNTYEELIKQAEELIKQAKDLTQAKDLMESGTNVVQKAATFPALEWKESDGKKYTWGDAKKLGEEGWRLPTRVELLRLYEEGIMPSENHYWSASSCAYSTSYAWIVSSNYGGDSMYNKYHRNYVRLVREVQENRK